MSDVSLTDLRAALERERDALRSQLAELGHGEGAELEYDQNFADSSQVTAERGETEALASRLEEALADVERALGKFEQGTYGACERCGTQIAPARLEAMPETRYCIDCVGRR